jgi:hypothetical protein
MINASGSKRKNKISRLCQDEGFIEGDHNLLYNATEFYKKLIGPS